jgi:ABC-2 type transport system permease protein
MQKYFQTVTTFARMFTKRFFRDKTAVFFTFVFPLIFLFVFGSLFKGDNGVSFDVAIINNSQSAFSQQFVGDLEKNEAVKKKDVTGLDDARKQMGQGELDSILVLPPEFGSINNQGQPNGQAIVYYDPGSAQAGQTFGTIIQSTLNGIDQQITGKQPLFTVQQQSTDQRGLSSFDYIFAGLLGFSILSLGMFGPTQALPSMKKEGILRRLRSTPLRVSQFVLANAFNYALVGILSIGLMFVVGLTVFDFQMQGSYLTLLLLVIIGVATMFGFGLSIGGWAKNENQAAPLTNLVAFPMMFLSGTFFPRFIMPEWLQHVTVFLPLTPIIDAIRLVTTEGKGLLQLGPQLGLIALWAIIIYVIAFRVFRWE